MIWCTKLPPHQMMTFTELLNRCYNATNIQKTQQPTTLNITYYKRYYICVQYTLYSYGVIPHQVSVCSYGGIPKVVFTLIYSHIIIPGASLRQKNDHVWITVCFNVLYNYFFKDWLKGINICKYVYYSLCITRVETLLFMTKYC